MSTLQERFDELIHSGEARRRGPLIFKTADRVDHQVNLTTQIVDLILEQAILERASDVHFETIEEKLRVRYRIDGRLYEALCIDNDPNLTILSRVKILANLATDSMAKKKSQDGRFTLHFGSNVYDFRVATFPTIQGEKMAVRILSQDLGLIQLDKLGLNPFDLKRLDKLLHHKGGLILVSGPMGCGKTTTLYAILNKLNKPDVNIVTLEDPVEYQFAGMNQCDIRAKTEFGFAEGLRAILRQDSDVILLGEIRDTETAEITLRASITGHIVLSSIHANSAIGTILRLLNMGLERYMVSYALIGAIAQRLVRKICQHCKTQHVVSPELLKRFKDDFGNDINFLTSVAETTAEGDIKYISEGGGTDTSLVLYKGEGCSHCYGSGYLGRTGIFEVVLFDEELRQAILRGASASELKEIAVRQGTRLLGMDGLRKIKQGITTLDEIIPVLVDK